MDLDNLDSGRNTNSLDTIYSNLYGKVDNNDLNVYLVPANILIYYNGLDGLASHATKPPPECHKSTTKSLILLKEKHVSF